jgi:Ca2+/Na+ antiporter
VFIFDLNAASICFVTKKTKKKKTKKASPKNLMTLFWVFFLIPVGAMMLVLAVWTALSPFSAQLDLVSMIDGVQQEVCEGASFEIWSGALLGCVGMLALVLIVLLIMSWDINPAIGESRWIFVSMYSLLLCVLLLVIFVAVSFSPVGASQFFGWTSLWLTCLWIPLVVSKMAPHNRRQTAHNSGQDSNSQQQQQLQPLSISLVRIEEDFASSETPIDSRIEYPPPLTTQSPKV